MNQVRFFPVILLLLAGLSAQAQFQTPPKQLSGTKSSRHVRIPNTQVFFIPPPGFKASKSGNAFLNLDYLAEINVKELDRSVVGVVGMLNKEELAKEDQEILESGFIKVRNDFARYAICRGKVFITDGCDIMYLIFGDKSHTVMVRASVCKGTPEIATQMGKSLETMVYDDNASVDLLEQEKYTLSWEGTQYQPAHIDKDKFILTKDGNSLPEIEDKSFMKVSGIWWGMDYGDKEVFFRDDFKSVAGKMASDIEISSFEKITVGGLEAFEMKGRFNIVTTETHKMNMYLLILLTSEGGYERVVGITRLNEKENMEAFQKIARTFRLR